MACMDFLCETACWPLRDSPTWIFWSPLLPRLAPPAAFHSAAVWEMQKITFDKRLWPNRGCGPLQPWDFGLQVMLFLVIVIIKAFSQNYVGFVYMDYDSLFWFILNQILKYVDTSSNLFLLSLSISSLAYPLSLGEPSTCIARFSLLASLPAYVWHAQTISNGFL